MMSLLGALSAMRRDPSMQRIAPHLRARGKTMIFVWSLSCANFCISSLASGNMTWTYDPRLAFPEVA
jgi:hypothetical protein